jgi:hypothetical protein
MSDNTPTMSRLSPALPVLWVAGASHLGPAARRLARVKPAQASPRRAERPDLLLWVQPPSGSPPAYFRDNDCKKALYLKDFSQDTATLQLEWARSADLVFHTHLPAVERLREAGLAAHWLPAYLDPSVRFPKPALRHDLCHLPDPTARDLSPLLDQLAKVCRLRRRYPREDLTRVLSGCRMALHTGRRAEDALLALRAGALLLAPEGTLTRLFCPDEELVLYRCAEDVFDLVEYYRENEPLRLRMTHRAQAMVIAAHQEEHRVADLLKVALGEKQSTCSIDELRERSLAQVEPLYRPRHTGKAPRSFVIPVLDRSPASPYNITTLLDDLQDIPGEVLVVFNDAALANALAHHPRITRWATMSQNIGVARAWNVGLELATTPVVFVLNADLTIDAAAVQAVHEGLETLLDAGCVGPEGSFFDMRYARDYLILGQGESRKPVQVDAVSGFLFAVWREDFGPGGLRFENAYTPCHFEEWDLGLQIKRLGKRSYVVPASTYAHHGGGSLSALTKVEFLGQRQAPGEILAQNHHHFLLKWRDLARREGRGDLLKSHFVHYGQQLTRELLATDRAAAAAAIPELAERAPSEPLLQVLAGLVLGLSRRPAEALQFYRKAAQLDPQLQIDRMVEEFMQEFAPKALRRKRTGQ